MKIIINYISLNIVKGILLVAILLLGIDLFFYLINELKLVGHGDYNLIQAIKFVALTIPRKLYILSPWAALLGTLLSLGAMAKSSELIAIRSFGISINKIALLGGIYVLFFTVMVFIAGELFAPKIETIAQQQKALALNHGKAIYTANGTWSRSGNKFIHIARINSSTLLSGITIYYLDPDFKLIESKFAQSATFLTQDNAWQLQNVIVTDFRDNNKIKANKYLQETEYNLIDFNILQAANVKHLERLSINNLYATIKERLVNNLTTTEYKIALWKKIAQPFSILIMSYLAVPFVFGPLRSSSYGLKLLVGIGLGLLFYLLNALFCPLVAVIKIPPVVAVMTPPMIFLLLATYLALRA